MTQKQHIQIRNSFKRYWCNRRYKDRLFRKIFKNKKDLLQLYNAINNTSYTNPKDLTITTLDDTCAGVYCCYVEHQLRAQ